MACFYDLFILIFPSFTQYLYFQMINNSQVTVKTILLLFITEDLVLLLPVLST